LTGVPWSERLVEVIADFGPAGYRYGSGCVVAGKTVLTAAHVIAGAVAVTVRDTSKRSYPAEIDAAFVGDPDGPGPDLALVQVDALPGDGYPPLGLGRAVRDSAVPVVIERCHAFGFPGFAESAAPIPSRDSVQAIGVIAALSKLARGLLSMVVSAEPAPLSPERARSGESPWSGMSGGPVVAEERLLGVVVEHSLAEGSSAITVVPLTALEANPAQPRWGPGVPDPAAWWRRLAVGGPADLHPVPTPSPTPETAASRTSAYLAQVARIAPTDLRGRDKELDELAEFCAAPDRGPYLWLRAPAWVGKSALMSWFVLHPPPGVRVVSFFITARFASQDDRVAFADAVLEQTLALLGRPVPALLTESTRDAHMLAQLNEAAALCLARAERLVLVIDGLDEDRGADGHSIAALLPARPVAGMRVIVTGRPNPPLPSDVREDHPLHDPATVQTLAQSPHAALTRARTQLELKRLLTDQSGDGDLLGFITAAGGGLTARDLAELTGRQAWQVEDRFRATAGRTFVTRAGTWQHQDTYVLGHEELQNDAVNLLGHETLEAYRQRLHDWAGVYARRGWPDDTPDFLLQGYFRLVQAPGSLARMVVLVTDPARQARMLARSGSESAAAAELTMTQDVLLAQEPPDLVAIATVAVHRDVMVRRNRNISADVPALWARLGAFARAEALAQSINDPEQRAAALRSIAAVASPARSDDPEPAYTPPRANLATADAERLASQDVDALISAARSTGGVDDAAALFDAAQATAYTARDPQLRADLWNDVVWARGSAAANLDALTRPENSTRPDTSLVAAHLRFAEFDDIVRRALAMGDLDRAAAIARTVHRADPDSGLLSAIVEHAVNAGHVGRAEQLALSFPPGRGQTDAVNRLVEMALKTGAPAGVEHIARMLAIEGLPRALVLVARVTWERGDAGRARALLAEALDAVPDGPPWEAEDAFADVVRTMARIGNVEEAASAAAARGGEVERLSALLAAAQGACDGGDQTRAKTLAAQVLQDAAAAAGTTLYGPWTEDPLLDSARLLARLGEAEQAAAAAQAIADPKERARILVEIVEVALEAGDLPVAEATRGLIGDPSARDELSPQFIRAHLRAGNHTAAMTATHCVSGAQIRADLVTEVVRHALDERGLDTADALVQEVLDHDVQVALRIDVARAAVVSAAPAQAQAFLEAAEVAARSAPDPAWRAEALTTAAWALMPGGDIGRIGALVMAAEPAARRIPRATPRAAALVNVAAIVAATGDPVRASKIFEEAATASAIPCAWAERLATLASAAADRGHHHSARAQLSAVGSLARWIADPDNRIRAEQARLAAAIHIGDLRQAEDAAHAIEHPDQRQLALVDVARALAAAGRTERAIAVALAIATADRQADALSEVARLAAARGEFDLAETAAHAITVRGGQAPALLSVAWEAIRAGDLARGEQIVASIADHEWRRLGLCAINAQLDAPLAAHTRPEAVSARTNRKGQAQDLLSRVDATPDHPSAPRLLAEAMRAGPCLPALASLGRVDPSAALAAADALLTLLR
jgi:tetratricopeptide (TPR) repeat protein